MFTILLLITGFFAGVFGSLLGLGGGVIIIPILTILFDLPIHTAIGISLVGVIATSTGAAMIYVREGMANVRLGVTLGLFTTAGAIAGAVIAGYVSSQALYMLFSALMFYTAYSMYSKTALEPVKPRQTLEEVAAGSAVLTGDRNLNHSTYIVKNIPGGMVFAAVAGIMSGLLGIGGGVINIPVMYLLMGLPLKAAAATSNFTIGVTASASAFVYFFRGHLDVLVAVPMVLGVFVGAAIGTRLNERVSSRVLKYLFIIVFIFVAVEMGLKGLGM